MLFYWLIVGADFKEDDKRVILKNYIELFVTISMLVVGLRNTIKEVKRECKNLKASVRELISNNIFVQLDKIIVYNYLLIVCSPPLG